MTVISGSLEEKKEEIWLNPVTKTPTTTEQSKKQGDHIKTPPKTLITQLLEGPKTVVPCLCLTGHISESQS